MRAPILITEWVWHNKIHLCARRPLFCCFAFARSRVDGRPKIESGIRYVRWLQRARCNEATSRIPICTNVVRIWITFALMFVSLNAFPSISMTCIGFSAFSNGIHAFASSLVFILWRASLFGWDWTRDADFSSLGGDHGYRINYYVIMSACKRWQR